MGKKKTHLSESRGGAVEAFEQRAVGRATQRRVDEDVEVAQRHAVEDHAPAQLLLLLLLLLVLLFVGRRVELEGAPRQQLLVEPAVAEVPAQGAQRPHGQLGPVGGRQAQRARLVRQRAQRLGPLDGLVLLWKTSFQLATQSI